MASNTKIAAGPEIGRRGFLAGSAGLTFGIAFGSSMGVTLVSAEAAMAGFEPNAWVTVGTDNSTCAATSRSVIPRSRSLTARRRRSLSTASGRCLASVLSMLVRQA